jgi:hypothetical protein
MSCHLDTWLFEELVAYCYRPERFTTADTMEREASVVRFLQLVCNVSRIDDKARDTFWKDVMGANHVQFGCLADVISHVEWIGHTPRARRFRNRPSQETDLIRDRCTTYLSARSECSCGCQMQSVNEMRSVLILPAGWYESEESHEMVRYTSVEDALKRYFAHPSMSESKCSFYCAGKVTLSIDARNVSMPDLLVLGTGASDVRLPFARDLKIGIATYVLTSVAWRTSGDGAHYGCNFRLPEDDTWHSYNDIDAGGLVRRALAFDKPPASMRGAQARAWYYSRTDDRSFNDVDLSALCSAYIDEPRFQRPDFAQENEYV